MDSTLLQPGAPIVSIFRTRFDLSSIKSILRAPSSDLSRWDLIRMAVILDTMIWGLDRWVRVEQNRWQGGQMYQKFHRLLSTTIWEGWWRQMGMRIWPSLKKKLLSCGIEKWNCCDENKDLYLITVCDRKVWDSCRERMLIHSSELCSTLAYFNFSVSEWSYILSSFLFLRRAAWARVIGLSTATFKS